MTSTPVSRLSISHPVLFACADRVTVPQVGGDETKLKGIPTHLSETVLPYGRPAQVKETLQRNYLKKVSADLVFSEDVVKLHAAHTLPYSKNDVTQAFKYSDIIQREHKRGATGPTGRHNARGTDKKHLPCHIKTVSYHHLKPIQRKQKLKAIETDKSEEEKNGVDANSSSTKNNSLIFLTQDPMTENDSVSTIGVEASQSYSENWDEHLLKHLSKNTARWIVNEKTTEGPQRDKLDRMVADLHGRPAHPVDTLIRDDASDITEVEILSHQGKEQWSKMKLRLSAKRRFKTPKKKKRTDDEDDSWDDDEEDEDDVEKRPLASFYKLPGGMRKQQKQMEKQLAGAVNSTAKEIKVTRKKTKPPPTLRDVMNPAVGDKMFDTKNQFEQEWLSGAIQVHKQDSSHLILDTGNKYQVLRQENFPKDPHTWFPDADKKKKLKKLTEDGGQKKKKTKRAKIPYKGYRKWSQRPEPIQDGASIQIHETGYDAELYKEPDPAVSKQHRENPALVKLVDEWRTKWHLGNRWYDSSIEDLVRDMSDINEHVRLQTIATIARAATFRPPEAPGIPVKSAFLNSGSDVLGKTMGQENNVKQQAAEGHLPAKLLECVEKALIDTCDRVRVTAAIALYTLCRPNEEANSILRRVIRTGTAPERWAAAQCLAHAGVCDSYVIGELVVQVFNSENVVKFEQCLSLMAKLSHSTTIVHSMVAEQLNSTSWRHRIIACRVLPRLSGTINKDITHKLANIMWNDWHKEVRTVAAQTLGKTGHGKEVHDELRERLISGSERDRIDALQKIGHLGIMTARLLPSYLSCFDDVYISVRVAAVTTASKLLLQEDKVITKLLFLTQYDNNWRVKAHALKALGDIGKLTSNIQAAIIWAVRFENERGVRAEACRTLVRVGIRGSDVAAILQDKLLVEPDELVREQLAIALESMGVSPTGDMEMVQQIKDEVRRLCTRGNIAAKIAHSEKKEDREENFERFFNVPSSPTSSPSPELKRLDSALRPSTKHSTRSETPNINIMIEDERIESPDVFLPNTPASEISESNRLYLSPVRLSRTGTTSPSRRTPEEKLDKLIELYDGACSLKEYKDYVKPEEEEGNDEDEEDESNKETNKTRKLEPIVENTTEEEQHLVADAAIQTAQNDGVDIDHEDINNGDVIKERSLVPSPTKTVDIVNALEADVELSIDDRSEVASVISENPPDDQ